MNAGLIETFNPDQQSRLHGWLLPPHSVLFGFQTVYTYPLEALRRRMRVHSMDSRQRAASLWTLAILAKTTAFRELFAGHIFNLKVMPAAANSLLVQDITLGRLKKQ